MPSPGTGISPSQLLAGVLPAAPSIPPAELLQFYFFLLRPNPSSLRIWISQSMKLSGFTCFSYRSVFFWGPAPCLFKAQQKCLFKAFCILNSAVEEITELSCSLSTGTETEISSLRATQEGFQEDFICLIIFTFQGGQGYPGQQFLRKPFTFGKWNQLIPQEKKTPSLGQEVCWLFGTQNPEWRLGVMCPWPELCCGQCKEGSSASPEAAQQQNSNSFCLPAAVKPEFCVIQQVPNSVWLWEAEPQPNPLSKTFGL